MSFMSLSGGSPILAGGNGNAKGNGNGRGAKIREIEGKDWKLPEAALSLNGDVEMNEGLQKGTENQIKDFRRDSSGSLKRKSSGDLTGINKLPPLNCNSNSPSRPNEKSGERERKKPSPIAIDSSRPIVKAEENAAETLLSISSSPDVMRPQISSTSFAFPASTPKMTSTSTPNPNSGYKTQISSLRTPTFNALDKTQESGVASIGDEEKAEGKTGSGSEEQGSRLNSPPVFEL